MSYNEPIHSSVLHIGDATLSQLPGYIDFEITDQEWFERHKPAQYVVSGTTKGQLLLPKQNTKGQLSSLQQRAPP